MDLYLHTHIIRSSHRASRCGSKLKTEDLERTPLYHDLTPLKLSVYGNIPQGYNLSDTCECFRKPDAGTLRHMQRDPSDDHYTRRKAPAFHLP
eukprot:scaffold784_cov123-Skeletonema_marinoi.AAC.9